jgi:hypothetical protein
MKASAATLLMLFAMQSCLAAEPAAPAASLTARLTDQVIAKAVRDTLAQEPKTTARGEVGTAFKSEQWKSFAQTFDEARMPGCLQPDGLKYQPAHIGPIALGGLLALPFLAAAVIRGKCH